MRFEDSKQPFHPVQAPLPVSDIRGSVDTLAASPPASELLKADNMLSVEDPAAVGDVLSVIPAPVFSLDAAGAGAGPAGIKLPQPSEDTSPCPVVTILAREVKLCAVEPACVASEHISSGCVLNPNPNPTPSPACCCCAGFVLECRPGRELLPLATLLASFVAAAKLPALLIWLMEPV